MLAEACSFLSLYATCMKNAKIRRCYSPFQSIHKYLYGIYMVCSYVI